MKEEEGGKWLVEKNVHCLPKKGFKDMSWPAKLDASNSILKVNVSQYSTAHKSL